jgi:dTDP-4-dehydrorhamnose reductase
VHRNYKGLERDKKMEDQWLESVQNSPDGNGCSEGTEYPEGTKCSGGKIDLEAENGPDRKGSMKILVTGSKGQLGYDVIHELEKRGHIAVGVDIDEMDITDPVSVERVIKETAPDGVIHCAAYTAVDAAEDNVELCRKVNGEGTANIVRVCKETGCKMMYISTDYVFNGQGERPWEPDDDREPLNVYGQTKYEGELAVEALEKYFIVRIAWVFGVNGKNFIKTMLNLGKTRDTITVVDDQVGSPTYTYDLARLLVDMIETEEYGRYHATNEGLCSWYEFACEIFRQAGLKVHVIPVSSDQYPARAKRPMNSRMSKDKLEERGFKRMPAWQDALGRYLKTVANL